MRARSLIRAFKLACVENPKHHRLGECLDVFINTSVDAFSDGTPLDLLLLEIEAHDEGGLTSRERDARRDWLAAIDLTLETLHDEAHDPKELRDIELAAFVDTVVQGHMNGDGIQIDRDLQFYGGPNRPVPAHLVPLAQIVLLTLREAWARDADDLYPGATG